MRKLTRNQFILVLIITFILGCILNFITLYFYIENTITHQINYLIVAAVGLYTLQKFMDIQNNQCMNILQIILSTVAMFILMDIASYLLHVNDMLAFILSITIVIIGLHVLNKRGYTKLGCKINKNK